MYWEAKRDDDDGEFVYSEEVYDNPPDLIAGLARQRGYGECECCGTQLPVDAVNAQGVSIWNLDHCRYSNTFRGILHERCNREIGDGNRNRKWAHVGYIEAHVARLNEAEHPDIRDEFQAEGAIPD